MKNSVDCEEMHRQKVNVGENDESKKRKDESRCIESILDMCSSGLFKTSITIIIIIIITI